MGDPFANQTDTPSGFGRKGKVVVPGAGDLSDVAKAIVCLSPGDVTIIPPENANAETLTFTGCPVGFVPPFQVRRVTAASGTWATIES